MSFWPLPKTLCDLLRAAADRGPVLEPGAGAGEFAAILGRLPLDVVLLDRSPAALAAAAPSRARVVGDVLRLPVGTARVGALVFGNVVRHLPAPLGTRAAREAARVLVPGGLLAVLEDDPAPRSPAERNYRDALELLALADASRGRALPPSMARAVVAPALGDPIAVGKGDNALDVREPLAPVCWLESRSWLPFPRVRVARLRRQIERDGMAYGRFWFQVFRKDAA